MITRIRDKLKKITYEWEWAKYFSKKLKEGWCLRFSMDHRGVWSRAGGWVDSGSQMGGSGVSDRGVKGGKFKCVGEVEVSIGSG